MTPAVVRAEIGNVAPLAAVTEDAGRYPPAHMSRATDRITRWRG